MRAPTAAKPSSRMPRVPIAVLTEPDADAAAGAQLLRESDAIGDQAVALEPPLRRGAALERRSLLQIEDDHAGVGAAEIEREARPLE